MDQDKPKFIYKYRPIENYDDLKSDYYLDALFNHYAIFSSRTNFNDLFDSKIDLIKPSAREIKEFAQRLPKPNRLKMLTHITKGKFTPEGEIFLSEVEHQFNNMIDSYGFMSLSSLPDSNLMWSHYAKSHYGFCIEYKTKYVTANKVTYAKDIPSLKIIDFYESFHGLSDGAKLGQKISEALLSKLDEWEYEKEYRFIAGKTLTIITKGERFTKVLYDFDFLESVIFGYRMDEKTKRFIIENMPADTKFKQATIGRNSMKIVDYKL
ncbi:Protein of uncharacterised function (DUF2971) [Yersinia intermedia]|uniref:DUF2971 domain-containing protein n=1 Tax=Yersinia intermedia TaxID=631 RepID=UPI0005E4A136|nr:DUF2971 domain-containing protein [Yersinia intermedia]CQJ57514.1 Protein of uncharacterised function (DUF2971) [Yersinia intermedia]